MAASSSRRQNRERYDGMSNRQSVRKFEFRPSRIKADFNVDFIADDEIFRGLCKDVNEAGIRAEFDSVIEPGRSGLLILRHRICELKLEAQVVYVADGQVVLVFLFKTASQHQLAVHFIASIANYIAMSSSH